MTAHRRVLAIENRHQTLRVVFAITKNCFAQNPLVPEANAFINMLSAGIGFKDIEPEPVPLQFAKNVIENSREHGPADSDAGFRNDNSLQSNRAMRRFDSTQDRESRDLPRLQLRDKIPAVLAR